MPVIAIRRSLLFLAALVLPVAAGAQQPPLQLEPIMFRLRDGTDIAAERGRFLVPEDRIDPQSRRIEIGFVRFRSTNSNPGVPIVYLAGGPGGSGIGTARGPRQPIFLALRQVGDVIALDQRGTGISNHIPPCTAARPLDPAAGVTEATLSSYYLATLRHCVPRWTAAGIAIRGYTTEASADDLEDLRRVLGVRQIDLWGISYGTHLALATMRRHPQAIRRVVLASVEGTAQTVKLPARVDSVFTRIDAAAGAPLSQLIRRVHSRIDAAPPSFTAAAADGTSVSFVADSFPLRMLAGGIPKNPEGIPQLAQLYGALDAGESASVAQILYDSFLRDPLTLRGMSELMDIASGISASRAVAVRRQAPGSLLGTATNFPMPQLRGAIPGLDLGDRFRREIRSRHPVLVLMGDLDVRTPGEEQEAAIAGLSNVHRILVRNGGHDLFEAHPEVPAILIDFFSGRPVRQRELVLPLPRPRAGGAR